MTQKSVVITDSQNGVWGTEEKHPFGLIRFRLKGQRIIMWLSHVYCNVLMKWNLANLSHEFSKSSLKWCASERRRLVIFLPSTLLFLPPFSTRKGKKDEAQRKKCEALLQTMLTLKVWRFFKKKKVHCLLCAWSHLSSHFCKSVIVQKFLS